MLRDLITSLAGAEDGHDQVPIQIDQVCTGYEKKAQALFVNSSHLPDFLRGLNSLKRETEDAKSAIVLRANRASMSYALAVSYNRVLLDIASTPDDPTYRVGVYFDLMTPFLLPTIDAFSPQVQTVLLALIEPSLEKIDCLGASIVCHRASSISTNIRLQANSLRAILSKLKQQGIIGKTQNGYYIADPIFALFLSMRYGNRKQSMYTDFRARPSQLWNKIFEGNILPDCLKQ